MKVIAVASTKEAVDSVLDFLAERAFFEETEGFRDYLVKLLKATPIFFFIDTNSKSATWDTMCTTYDSKRYNTMPRAEALMALGEELDD